MTCPTCNGPLARLFTSSYCPACDAREAAPVVVRDTELTDEQAYALDNAAGWVVRFTGSRLPGYLPPQVTSHPLYKGTFIIPPDDEDGEW